MDCTLHLLTSIDTNTVLDVAQSKDDIIKPPSSALGKGVKNLSIAQFATLKNNNM